MQTYCCALCLWYNKTTITTIRVASSPAITPPSKIPATSPDLSSLLESPPLPVRSPVSPLLASTLGSLVGGVIPSSNTQSGPWMFSRVGSQVGSKWYRSLFILTEPWSALTQAPMMAATSEALWEEVPVILAR